MRKSGSVPTIEPTPAPSVAVPAARRAAASAGLVAIALVVVYLVWGSTYLGIRVVVKQAPPLTASGARYVVAAILLGLLLSTPGRAAPTAGDPARAAGL